MAPHLNKFVGSASAVINMAKGSLKFTPIDQLNDPAEMLPIMNRNQVEDSLTKLRREGMTQEQFRWLKHQDAVLDLLAPEEKALNAPKSLDEANQMLSLTAYENLDFMERKLISTIKKIRKNVGVLSLSESYKSLPMWAHYANNARGFVVTLKDLHIAFPGDQTGSLNEPKFVRYTDDFEGMTYDPSTQDRLFFSKLSDWSYEDEWRVVLPLHSCTKDVSAGLFLFNIDRSHVESVIFGWQIEKEARSQICEELANVNPYVRFESAEIHRGQVVRRHI